MPQRSMFGTRMTLLVPTVYLARSKCIAGDYNFLHFTVLDCTPLSSENTMEDGQSLYYDRGGYCMNHICPLAGDEPVYTGAKALKPPFCDGVVAHHG